MNFAGFIFHNAVRLCHTATVVFNKLLIFLTLDFSLWLILSRLSSFCHMSLDGPPDPHHKVTHECFRSLNTQLATLTCIINPRNMRLVGCDADFNPEPSGQKVIFALLLYVDHTGNMSDCATMSQWRARGASVFFFTDSSRLQR